MKALVSSGFLLLSLGLSAAIAYQALAPVAPIEVADTLAPVKIETSLTLPTFAPPSAQEFVAINERPVFSPTRQPIAEPPEAGSAAPPPDVVLLGVVIGPQKSVALLKLQGLPLAISAAVGQMVGGWQLTRIEPGRVIFRANMTDFEIRLRSGQAAGTKTGP
jgi:hypothetical protein